MLVVSREKNTFHDDQFPNFHRYLRPGDCLVLNNTRVFPARLHGKRNREDGAGIEVFLTRALNQEQTIWSALVKPAKRAVTGDRVLFGKDFYAEIIAQGEFGERTIQFHTSEPIEQLIDELGRIPLPPYIHRVPDASDRERYQTVFAEKRGSVAAPTAGLHFTPQILEACRAAGATVAYITLHVGLGTFAPLRESKIEAIQLHEEYFEVSEAQTAVMQQAKRLVCVGTTSVRTIETALLRGGLQALQGETNLFIHPGFRFRGTGAMLTNFHLPESSLLMLVSAFGGHELILTAYRHAVAEKYRFFSYGDCMLID
jgi:S-adenosylmethionine:tRNA ribosyltransferase-isomerase